MLLSGAAAALAIALGPATAASQDVPQAAPSDVSCRFDQEAKTLALRAGDQLTRILRVDDEIRFLDGRQAIDCGGGVRPTVDNVDTIRIESNQEFVIDLRNGQLAPGVTDEEDGSSEIEIRGVFKQTGGVRVRGSSGPDILALGIVGDRRAINLNADEAKPDADVTITGGFRATSVLARGGDDRLKASGGAGFDGPLNRTVAVSLGSGNDWAVGTDRRDLIGGGAGNDVIDPRSGRDRIRTQAGHDVLELRDSLRDVVSCGSGRDRANADPVDLVTDCESVSNPDRVLAH